MFTYYTDLYFILLKQVVKGIVPKTATIRASASNWLKIVER